MLNKGSVSLSDIRMYNPLVLAYVGDAVYELYIRTQLVSSGSMQVAKLHKRSINYVKAKSQAEILSGIEDILTEEELDIVRRGRNTKSATVPKNADISDYRYATGFESLLGYLYLIGSIERLMEILNRVMVVRNT
ncbi:MAG: Mini-ribonuclease 3 [Bacillota bacterium]